MHKKQVAVEDLELGMFVVELDRPWVGTPFDFRGFPIATQEQIDSLRACCETVYVDPERQSAFGLPPRRHAVQPTRPTEPTSIEEELPFARDIHAHFERVVTRSLRSLRDEAWLEPDDLGEAVGRMAESMQRNADAMLLLDGVREKSDPQVERALSSSILMMAFGRSLEFDRRRLETLGLAGVFLDVGKCCVPDAVLNKSAMLTPAEYRVVKKHVVHSVELVRAANGRFPAGLDDIILQHHERQDGSGYPRGLTGDQIMLEGSIAGIVDSFSALTLPRPFAEPHAPSNALNLLHTMRGTCFDETLVERFIQCVGGYPVGGPVELNTGEIGVVIAQNRAHVLEPRVMLVLDCEGNALRHPQRVLDFCGNPAVRTGEPYRIRRALARSTLPPGTANVLVERLCGKKGSGVLVGTTRA
jgi:HD-GYP domain-containing protein (c-di-GMP phosphodiesterase class II)